MSKFSHLYHEKTINVLSGETVLFQVTVTEIQNGAKAKLQRENFKNVDLAVTGNKKQAKREIQARVSKAMKDTDATALAARETLLGVKAWTLCDDDGKPAAVSYENWIELPEFITKQIENAVEELNPDETDEGFLSEDGNAD